MSHIVRFKCKIMQIYRDKIVLSDVTKPGEGQLALAEDAGDGELPLLLDQHHEVGLGNHHREKGRWVTDRSHDCPSSLRCELRQTRDQLTGDDLTTGKKTFSFLELDVVTFKLNPPCPRNWSAEKIDRFAKWAKASMLKHKIKILKS